MIGQFGLPPAGSSTYTKLCIVLERETIEVGLLVLLSQYLRGYQYLIAKSHFTAV